MRRKIYKYRHNLRAKHIFQSGFLQSTMATWKKVYKKINFRRTTRYFFFSIRFSFTGTGDSRDSRGREGTIFYSTLSLRPAHEHSDICLQLCTWDDYHIFLITMLVFTRLLLVEIFSPYRIASWLIDDVKFVLVCLLDGLILGFCYSNLDTGKRWTWTPIDYHPRIISELTNQLKKWTLKQKKWTPPLNSAYSS